MAIWPRGAVYTQDNVGDALPTRNVMRDLRGEGTVTGGPAALGPRAVERFAYAIDRELVQLPQGSV